MKIPKKYEMAERGLSLYLLAIDSLSANYKILVVIEHGSKWKKIVRENIKPIKCLEMYDLIQSLKGKAIQQICDSVKRHKELW